MRSPELRRVLVYATGPLGERLAGPEIRALEFAKALGLRYDVTVAAQRLDPCERDGLRVVPATRRTLLREVTRHDAILCPFPPPYLLVLKEALGFAAIADQYDPYDLELVSLERECHRRELRLHALAQAINLRYADAVLCASESQRRNLRAAAQKLQRCGYRVSVDPVVVPFGVPEPPPDRGRQPLRERFPQISGTDTVVLWWGAVWRWLDAETAIRAFAVIARSNPKVKLVITAGSPPNRHNQRFDAVPEARALAAELGLLDRTVLFLDEWIPYEQRHDYLREADIGLTLHRSSDEAQLAARSRYMDYLSAALPCVLGRGDETAAEFEAAGFATLVGHRDPDLLAKILLELVEHPEALQNAASAGRRLAAERRWSAVGETLREAVAAAWDRQPASARIVLESLRGTASYYALKLADRLSA